MDFRKLLEGDCGQVNPLAQLATHVTQNHARQENASLPFLTNQIEQEQVNKNEWVSNTFNMNELMAQLQNTKSPISMVPPASVTHNHPFDGFSFEESMVRLQQNINFPVNQPQAYLPSVAEYHHQFQLRQQQRPIGAEEFQRMQRDIAEAQAIFNEPEEDKNVIEEQVEILNSEVESSKNISKQPAYLCYDHLWVENVYGISNQGTNDTEYFYNFVENYVLENSSRKYQKYLPNKQNELGMDEINSIGNNFHNIISSNIVMEYTYTKWLQCDINCGALREELTKYLASSEQFYDVITVSKCIDNFCMCDCNKNLRKSVFPLTDAYLHEHCFYQACQTLFNWLKNEPDYEDIAPPNFLMEDKTESIVDKEQLRALTKMFIKAAQRNPGDSDLQIALAKLCEIDQDYEKSIDCYKSILTREMDDEKSVYISMCLGKIFALSNKPNQAMDTFWEMRLHDSRYDVISNYYTNMGLILLYNKYYGAAASYLFDAVNRQMICSF